MQPVIDAEGAPLIDTPVPLPVAALFCQRGEAWLRAMIAAGQLPATDGPDGPLVTRADLLKIVGSSYSPVREVR